MLFPFVILLGLIPIQKSIDAKGYRKVNLQLEMGFFNLKLVPSKEKNITVEGEYDPDFTDSVKIYTNRYNDELKVHVRTYKEKNLKFKPKENQRMEIKLPIRVPYVLNCALGFTEGDFDLTGLRIQKADFSIGGGDVKINFIRSSPGIDTLNCQFGLANLTINRLGNSKIGFLKISSGLGRVKLDLRGKWKEDMEIDISSGLQSLELSVPYDLGIYLEIDGILNLKDLEGMEKAEGGYISKNFKDAKHRVHIKLEGALNQIDLDWVKGNESSW